VAAAGRVDAAVRDLRALHPAPQPTRGGGLDLDLDLLRPVLVLHHSAT